MEREGIAPTVTPPTPREWNDKSERQIKRNDDRG